MVYDDANAAISITSPVQSLNRPLIRGVRVGACRSILCVCVEHLLLAHSRVASCVYETIVLCVELARLPVIRGTCSDL